MRRVLLSLGLLALTAVPVWASPINGAVGVGGDAPSGPVVVGTATGSWYRFYYGGTGSFATGGAGGGSINEFPSLSAPPWTFTGPAVFQITDAFLAGDQFTVFDFGVPIGTTNVVPVGGGTEANPDPAFANPIYSKGAFAVGGGNHSITIQAINSPFGAGGSFFRVVQANVPEPMTLAVFGGLALAGLGVTRRRRA